VNYIFPSQDPSSRNDQIQGRLLSLAALFLLFYSIALTLSPAVRAHSLSVPLRWDHWIGFAAWLILFAIAHRRIARLLPERDPYLLSIAAFLSGWGLLTIWRLSSPFGLRQTLWLGLGVAVLTAGASLPNLLNLLRRYKYLWLTSGLLLTGLTLLFGTYPSGIGPHEWLGCCGIYLQPSEPLKLLLIIYLAAYLADRLPLSFNLAHLLLPTLVLFGLALALLVAQRDLGTATLFIALYGTIVYIASGRRRLIWISALVAVLAVIAGYRLFDVVRLRVDAWINPWLDPSGRSFQVVQSLITIASGGIIGRGPGLGNPGVVPVAQSDFIFSAVAEETGLVGTIGLVLLMALLVLRGIRSALNASNQYQRYLAAGLSVYLGVQSILILGGNLRLVPLTGVTLPFLSYGGSSLLTVFLALLLLLVISNQPDIEAAQLSNPRPYLYVGGVLLAAFSVAVLLNGWWSVIRSPDLLSRNDNPRRGIADRYVMRGSLLDRTGQPLDTTIGQIGSYTRFYQYPPLSPVLGYTHPLYGQAGLEASYDLYLRGLEDNPGSLIWWDHLIYGQPPPGLDVRLTLDMRFQRLADQLLGNHHGAVVMLNAQSGEVLVMASHPYFDPSTLDQTWNDLIKDKNAPLLNRATQGLYPAGTVLGPFLLADATRLNSLPALPGDLAYPLNGDLMNCSQPVPEATWGAAISAGCPSPLADLGNTLGSQELASLYSRLGFYKEPSIPLLTATVVRPSLLIDPKLAGLGQEGADVSPLQMALAAAAITNNGIIPAPRMALSVHTSSGWSTLAPTSAPVTALPAGIIPEIAQQLAIEGLLSWQTVGQAQGGQSSVLTWYIGGSLPEWKGTPLAVALVLEEDDPNLAIEIGQALLRSAQNQ
jgi:cell division protein FtsW (lipid II flippase)